MHARAVVDRALWLALLAAAAWIYGPVASKLFHDWATNPDYSHGFIVLPVALWLMWDRFREPVSSTGASGSGVFLVCLASVLLVVGRLGAELFLTRVSLLMFFGGSVVFLSGWRMLRRMLFPLALVALAIPLPAIVIGRLALWLQLAASSMAASILGALGVPVLADGNVLVLPGATLQVAEACSGIRSLAALFTLGLLVARWTHHRWLARLSVLAAAVPVAIAVNGVRVAATGFATLWWGARATVPAHDVFGFLMFGLAFACLRGAARAIGSVATRLERAPA